MAAISNIEDLRFWFNSQPYVLWTMYRGHQDRKQSSSILARNESITDREQSFAHLQKMIEINSHGRKLAQFTVLTKPNKSVSTGMTVLLEMEQQKATKSSINGHTNEAQIYGMSATAFEHKVRADERYKVETEYKLEELEDQLAAKQNPGWQDKLVNMATQNPAGFQQVCMGVMGLFGGVVQAMNGKAVPQVASISSQGFNEQEKSPEAPSNTEPPFQYDPQRVSSALELMRSVYPDIHEFLEELAPFIVADPQRAQMIRSLIKQPQMASQYLNMMQANMGNNT